MAIKFWDENGRTHYLVKVVTRSRSDRSLRVRRQEAGVLEERDPATIEKQLNRIQARLASDARRELVEREGAGLTWGDLVKKWEKSLEEEARNPDTNGLRKPVKWATARTHIQAVNDFTTSWMKRPASEVTPADVEDVFRGMRRLGYSDCRMYNAKVSISQCFRWGLMRRLIPGMAIPPTHGFGISRKQSKRPEILNVTQIQYLMDEAYRRQHPWRHVWRGTFHTGARSGESFQLKRRHLDLVERKVILEEKWNFLDKRVEPLKDGEWRQIPINSDLMALLTDLGVPEKGPEDFVFPRINAWKNGEAARVLRDFCEEIELPSICFHTLRACWATQLLRNNVPHVKVMAMGGWSDPETMHRYIRIAGIDLEGATESLSSGLNERSARVLKLVVGREE